MKRALELASWAGTGTRPNPMVGAVIVHNDMIIGEGYHLRAGEAHAEVNAINSAPPGKLPEATIYVTLEPCSHYGRTPPCAELIVSKGIKRVVIGTKDTSSKVSGRGMKILEEGGCEVRTGVMEKECRELNHRFFTFHEKGRPYIILKWAESKDGYIDREDRADLSGPNWISGRDEKLLVHRWRTQEHSIMIGRNTLIKDNPALTARLFEGINPLRIVLSDSADFPEGLTLLTDNEPLLLFSGKRKNNLGEKKENILIKENGGAVGEVLDELVKREIQSLMVEGGANVLNQFIEKGLWDEARIFRGRTEFGSGIKSPDINGTKFEEIDFDLTRLVFLKRSLVK